ncbi:hypothetical protein [Amphritea sp. HPY]|uniref:hypothetical protein n=1 Tax=Amphritea sp. HPY TaxID=3421652 RepID=UPI003D7E9CDC
MVDKEFLSYWLMHIGPKDVFSWLEENRPKLTKLSLSSYRDPEIESLLLSRSDPLIDLGLALYGHCSETGMELYKRGGEKKETTVISGLYLPSDSSGELFQTTEVDQIKKAVLSGSTVQGSFGRSWVVENGILGELITSGSYYLVNSFLSNGFCGDEIIENIFEKKGVFEHLEDELWLNFIRQAASNPRLSFPVDDLEMFGYRFSEGWKLFETLPVSDRTASTLAVLGKRLLPERAHGMKILKAIERWRVKNSDKPDSNYFCCRFLLSGLIEDFNEKFKKLCDSDDPALRYSYYSRFSTRKLERVRELFNKDEITFLEPALKNENLYKYQAVREELRECCCDYKDPDPDIMIVDVFDYQADQRAKQHPEWFDNLDDILRALDLIDDPCERYSKQLELLSRQVQNILKPDDKSNVKYEGIQGNPASASGEKFIPESKKGRFLFGILVGAVIVYVLHLV